MKNSRFCAIFLCVLVTSNVLMGMSTTKQPTGFFKTISQKIWHLASGLLHRQEKPQCIDENVLKNIASYCDENDRCALRCTSKFFSSALKSSLPADLILREPQKAVNRKTFTNNFRRDCTSIAQKMTRLSNFTDKLLIPCIIFGALSGACGGLVTSYKLIIYIFKSLYPKFFDSNASMTIMYALGTPAAIMAIPSACLYCSMLGIKIPLALKKIPLLYCHTAMRILLNKLKAQLKKCFYKNTQDILDDIHRDEDENCDNLNVNINSDFKDIAYKAFQPDTTTESKTNYIALLKDSLYSPIRSLPSVAKIGLFLLIFPYILRN